MPDNFTIGSRVRVIDRGSWCYGRTGSIVEDEEERAYAGCPRQPADVRLMQLDKTRSDTELVRLFETRHLEEEKP